MKTKIMALDLGSVTGISIWNGLEYVYSDEKPIAVLTELFDEIEGLLSEYDIDLIIIPYPTRFYNTIIKHAKQMGVVNLVAEQYSIQTIEVNDSHCKKVVLGKGKASKEEVQEAMGTKKEHVADARMFTQSYLKEIEQGNYL